MTELRALDDLARRGFSGGFRVVDGNLRVLTTGKLLRPEDLVIREVYRFEGISDPDDMAIVYAIESTTGVRGTLIDAFGVYADRGMEHEWPPYPGRLGRGNRAHRSGRGPLPGSPGGAATLIRLATLPGEAHQPVARGRS